MDTPFDQSMSGRNAATVVPSALSWLSRRAGRHWPPAQMHAGLQTGSQIWMARTLRRHADKIRV